MKRENLGSATILVHEIKTWEERLMMAQTISNRIAENKRRITFTIDDITNPDRPDEDIDICMCFNSIVRKDADNFRDGWQEQMQTFMNSVIVEIKANIDNLEFKLKPL